MGEIYCLDSNGNRVYNLYQWDSGQKLIINISGLNIDTSSGIAAHFCNKESEFAYSVEPTITGNLLYADIPNALLRVPLTILAYIYVGDGTSNKTTYAVRIPVRPRKQPSDYVYDDNVKLVTLDTLIAQVQALEKEISEDISGKYLPLSGGTVTGNVIVDGKLGFNYNNNKYDYFMLDEDGWLNLILGEGLTMNNDVVILSNLRVDGVVKGNAVATAEELLSYINS